MGDRGRGATSLLLLERYLNTGRVLSLIDLRQLWFLFDEAEHAMLS